MPRPKRQPLEREVVAQRERFIDEYMVDFNGAKAAIRAGYSEATAKNAAYRMLAEPNVQAIISQRIKARQVEAAGRAQKVIADLHHEAETAPKASERIRALELLAKHYGLLNDKVEHTIFNGGDAQIVATATPQEAIEVYATILN